MYACQFEGIVLLVLKEKAPAVGEGRVSVARFRLVADTLQLSLYPLS